MKNILDILLLGLSTLYQLTLASRLEVRGIGVDVLCVLLSSLALLQGPVYGSFYGLVVGLILDGVFGHVGYYAAMYLFVGFMAGLLSEKVRMNRFILPVVIFVGLFLVKELYAIVYIFFSNGLVSWGMIVVKTLACTLLSAGAFFVAHWLLTKVHKWEVIQAPLFKTNRW